MSLFRPRATVLQRAQSTSQSDNSHSSESAASHPSNVSSNTSLGTHLPMSFTSALNLPKGAAPPQPGPPAFLPESVSSPASGTSSPDTKRKSRVLRKAPPSAFDRSIASVGSVGAPSGGGLRRWISLRAPSKGPPSRSPSRVRVNLDDDPSVVFMNGASGPTRRFSLPARSKLCAPTIPSTSELSRRSHSPQRSLSPRRSRSPGRARAPNGRSFYVSERGPQEVLDRLRGELVHVGKDLDNHMSSTKGEAPNRLVSHLNKPLPPPPGPSRTSTLSPTVSHPNLNSTHYSLRPPISYRHSSYSAASEVEKVESQFGHFNSGPYGGASGPYENAYTPHNSWSDVGHAQGITQNMGAWSDSGHGSGYVTSGWDDARSEALYQASEPHYQRPSSSFTPLSTPYPLPPLAGPVRRPASSSFTTLSTKFVAPRPPRTVALSTRSAPLYPSRTSLIERGNSSGPTSQVSLGKRIKRTLSLSWKHVGPEQAQNPPSYSYSDTGHGTEFVEPAYVSPTPLSPQSEPQTKGPQKLKKRVPSLSNTLAIAPVSGMSDSRPVAPSHTQRESGSPSPKKRSRSSLHMKAETPPPVPPLPLAFSPPPLSLVHDSQSPSAGPSSSPVRRLTKRRPSGKKAGNGVRPLDMTFLPPVRAVSPLHFDGKESHFSHASRSHSTPNLWPPGPSRTHPPGSELESAPQPQFLSFLTESPPSSPHTTHPVDYPRQEPVSDRPSFLRSQSNRRWTLAASEIPDELLVAELERLRSVGWGLGFQGELIRVKSRALEDGDGPDEQTAEWERQEDEGWLIARRALMVCREIVRTERNYRDGMIRLQRGDTQKAPPPLLLQYLPALISASHAFSARLDEDPSAWGVSAAFLGVEDALEIALVSWSGVIGEFLTSHKGKRRRHWSTSIGDKEKKEKEKKRESGAPTLPPVGWSDDRQQVYERPAPVGTKSTPSSWRMSMPALSQLLTSSHEPSPSENRKMEESPSPVGSDKPTKVPTMQDLAIQPTQRVMRYVLLYKDLLNSTPIASPARPLVERALEGATRIAQRCNRAQDNAAFLA